MGMEQENFPVMFDRMGMGQDKTMQGGGENPIL